MSALGDHARAELTRIGAPDEIQFPVINMVGEFALVDDVNQPLVHQYLEALLSFGALTTLTNNPAEWTLLTLGDAQVWQSVRTPDAWSKDPNHNTYFLISELEADGTVVLHPTVPYTP